MRHWYFEYLKNTDLLKWYHETCYRERGKIYKNVCKYSKTKYQITKYKSHQRNNIDGLPYFLQPYIWLHSDGLQSHRLEQSRPNAG